MTKKTIKTENVLEVYQVLSGAKFSKLDGSEQTKLVGILLAFEPVAKKYEQQTKTASEKLKEAYPNFDEMATKANTFREMLRVPNVEADKLPMGAAEYQAFVTGPWAELNKRVAESVKAIGEKPVEVEFEPISVALREKLMESNSSTWTIGHGKVLATITE